MSVAVTATTVTSLVGAAERAAIVAVNRLLLMVANLLKGTPGLAIGTTTTKVKFANTSGYSIDGKPLSKTATDDFWTLSGTTLSAGQSNKYLLYVDSAGAASMAEGIPATSIAGVIVPFPAQAKSCFGVVTVTCNSSTFVPGTTALNAGTITVTYTDGPPVDWLAAIGNKNNNVMVTT